MIDTNITSIVPFISWLVMVISGSLIATYIVIKLTARTIKKKILETLGDETIQQSVSSFVKEHIVQPFNELDNNSEIKKLIHDTTEKSLEIALNKLREKEKE
ncbi:hypothetical protein KAX02_08730 [candidate division WOR-3 bacterium]|nr:hypothetical protein [candidate division WOR-3 bacterium]